MSIARENLTRAVFEDTAFNPATEALAKNKFITELGAIAGDGEPGCVSIYDWNSGDRFSVVRIGTVKVLSGAAVSVGADVQSDSEGRAITLDEGVKNGRALTAATAANQIMVIQVS